VGEFSPWHGIDILLESFPLVLNELKDVKLLLVGSGIMGDKLIEIAKMKGIHSKVVFAGLVHHDTVSDYINSSDICVAPFTKKRNENTGISPLKIYEYLACEKAVISSRIKNLEFLEDNNLGILTEPDNPQMLAESIIYLLNHKELAENMGQNGRIYVEKNHNWLTVADNLYSIFKKLTTSDCVKTIFL
jgi:glycosyltransferase involved in cell wall biosynthesis